MKDIHTYTFMNFTTYMTNGTPEYITLKNNDVCVENILGTYIAGEHSAVKMAKIAKNGSFFGNNSKTVSPIEIIPSPLVLEFYSASLDV